MRRFKFITLWPLVLASLLSSNVYAVEGDGDEESVDAATAVEQSSEVIDTSLRIAKHIEGFEILNVAGVDIEATYLEETLGEPHGAIIFFHDQGAQLESLGVITPLRHKMIEYGWSTLTLALDYPSPANILLSAAPEISVEEDSNEATASNEPAESTNGEANEDNAPVEALPPISNQQRIDSAIAFLHAKGITRILFLGHGAGGYLAVEILSELTEPISALILVGVPELSPVIATAFNIMQQPILDVYGENDLDGVIQAVKKRKLMMKRAGNSLYSERKIIGADHLFYGLESTLSKTIKGRLNTIFIKPKEEQK